MDSSVAKRLRHILRVVYYMLHKGLSKRQLMLDLHLIIQRGKLAGKALGGLLALHPHGSGAAGLSAFSCRSVDPSLSFYTPREVEFSCSNTPAFPSLRAARRKHHRHRSYTYDAAAIAKDFEILVSEAPEDQEPPVAATPSPAPFWGFGKSPVPMRQLRITDSSFLVCEEGEYDGRVDREAEEFIRRFYEQLHIQVIAVTTPEYAAWSRGRPTSILGRS